MQNKIIIVYSVLGLILAFLGLALHSFICIIFGLLLLCIVATQRINARKEQQKELGKKEIQEYEHKMKDFYNSCNLICLDCETTGLDPKKDEILKLSIIDRNNNVLFNELIKPANRKRWNKAAEVNGITPEMVKDCKTIDNYIEQLKVIVDNCDLIVGYNVEFDLSFLDSVGVGTRLKKKYDVMEKFSAIKGEWNSKKQDFKYQKLSVCADYYGYKWQDKQHDSLEDSKATLYCFKEIVK